jgi:hypothetical protein
MLTHIYTSFNVLLLHIIHIAVIFFLLLAIAIPCVTVFLSWRRKRVEHRRNILYEEYEGVIFPFLYHGNMDHIGTIQEKLGKIDKWVFSRILNDLSLYFKYADQEKIKQIAAIYDIESYLLKNIRWKFSVYKVRALKILVNIGCTEKSLPKLKNLQKSKDFIVRLYSIQNLILYGSFNIEVDFPNYKYPLSLWEQMSYFFLFKYRMKEEPDFSSFLYSSNVTIILFGLRMIRLFGQNLDISSDFEHVLMSKDKQVQMELYRLLARRKKHIDAGYDRYLNVYPLEDMLSNYARLDYVDTDTMLDIYQHTEDMAVKKHILICIYDYVSGGKADIEYFAAHHDRGLLNRMCKNLIMEKNG